MLYSACADQAGSSTHSFATGRRTWKMSKNSEVIWPLHIEAALFDGLEKYRPTSPRNPLLLRRFPKRNRFLADHIYKLTGQRRTPKQVGSRLQQLRDTCSEAKVLRLLSRREFPPEAQTTSATDLASVPVGDPGKSSQNILASAFSPSPFTTTTLGFPEDSTPSCTVADRGIGPIYPCCEIELPLCPVSVEQTNSGLMNLNAPYDPFMTRQLEAPQPTASHIKNQLYLDNAHVLPSFYHAPFNPELFGAWTMHFADDPNPFLPTLNDSYKICCLDFFA